MTRRLGAAAHDSRRHRAPGTLLHTGEVSRGRPASEFLISSKRLARGSLRLAQEPEHEGGPLSRGIKAFRLITSHITMPRRLLKRRSAAPIVPAVTREVNGSLLFFRVDSIGRFPLRIARRGKTVVCKARTARERTRFTQSCKREQWQRCRDKALCTDRQITDNKSSGRNDTAFHCVI